MIIEPSLLMPAEYDAILRRDLMSFIVRAFHELSPQTKLIASPYIEVMATHLEACRLRKEKRLIINVPPRSLKSVCVSVAFVAWCLGHNPAMEVICASYGQDSLSEKLARDCRAIMTSAFYKRLFGTRLAPDRHAVHDFMTTERGGRMSTSVGGPMTGRGGDLIIIDDPIKSDDALSETKRKSVNDWYDNTIPNRLNKKSDAVVIVVMQRLHQDDLVGHLLEKGDDWKVLSFPAIATEDETHIIENVFGTRLFTRKTGEVLDPNLLSLETLEEIRRSVGEYNFFSQYQQDPAPEGGAIIKTEWLQYYDINEKPARFDRIVQSWDTANKSTDLSDYSVCTTWGSKGKLYYLLHVYRGRLIYPDLRRKVKELQQIYRSNAVLIEDKASGTQLIQDLTKFDGVSFVKPYEPPTGMDKIMRLNAQTMAFETGRVFLPRNAFWVADYVHELTSFPGSKYDDQVDSTSQALAYMELKMSNLEVWIRLGQ